MPTMLDNERRKNGSFAGGSKGFGPKSPPNASEMLVGGRRRLALSSCSATISIPTQPRVLNLSRP
jgi:hypothetical protein